MVIGVQSIKRVMRQFLRADNAHRQAIRLGRSRVIREHLLDSKKLELSKLCEHF